LVARVERLLIDRAELGLPAALARVVLAGDRRGLARIGIDLGPGESEWVLRRGLVVAVQHQDETAMLAEVDAELRVVRLAAHPTVLPVTAGDKFRHGDVVVDWPDGATRARAVAERVVAAGVDAQGGHWRWRAVRTPHLHHAAGGVAVQH